MFVGIDWASRAHELCVVDEEGEVVERFGFAHSERGIREALERLTRLDPPAALPVAIERPDGLLVGRLLDAGHPVVPMHPNAFHAARPRWEGLLETVSKDMERDYFITSEQANQYGIIDQVIPNRIGTG